MAKISNGGIALGRLLYYIISIATKKGTTT